MKKLLLIVSCLISSSVFAKTTLSNVTYSENRITVDAYSDKNGSFFPLIEIKDGEYSDFTIATSEIKFSDTNRTSQIVLTRLPGPLAQNDYKFSLVLIGLEGEKAAAVKIEKQ